MKITTTTGEIVTTRTLLEVDYDKTALPNEQRRAFFCQAPGSDDSDFVYIPGDEYHRLAAMIEGPTNDQQAEAHAARIAILTGELEAARIAARGFAETTIIHGHASLPSTFGQAMCRECFKSGPVDQILHIPGCRVGRAREYLRATAGDGGNE